MNINQNYIDKIFKELVNQPIYSVDKLKDNAPKNFPGLYFIYCDLIYNHKYLKFGKSENLKRRVMSEHLGGSVENSIYNAKLSRDEKIKILLPEELEFEENDDKSSINNRISFTKEHCTFKYLNLSIEFVNDCEKIFYDNKLYNEWAKKWNRKSRNEDHTVGTDNRTILIEKPIEQNIKNEIRYIERQPSDWIGWNTLEL